MWKSWQVSVDVINAHQAKEIIWAQLAPKKPEIRDIGLMLGEAWSKRQDWAGPSMKFEDEKDYCFGKS